MIVRLKRGELASARSGALAIGILESRRMLDDTGRAIDRATHGALSALIGSGDFTGRFLECALLYPTGRGPKRVIAIGLGAAETLDTRRVRLATALVVRKARELRARTLALPVFGAGAGGLEPVAAARAAAEGAVLGHYRHTAYKREPGAPALTRIEFLAAEPARTLGAAIAQGAAWGEAVALARDLANTPGADLTPERLAARARDVAAGAGARIEVLGVPQMERLGMGCVLAVGRGSPHPPRFIVLERGPTRAARGRRTPTLVLVGKGITFDTGGISLKPRENMHKMKYDMSGAAAVLGVFAALPTLAPGLRVIGLIASAENMPDGDAFKPGDVLRAIDGTTIEITNTDAEGRLVLADALGYARRYQPDAVVDLATLTGAMSIALGSQAAGLFTADDTLAAELLAASETSGERLWRFPMWEEYLAELRSDTADLVNSGAREGGSIIAAKFLQHFAGDLRWAHLDIAPTAWTASERPHETRGATGFGVRLLLEWLSRRGVSPAS